MRRAKLLSTVNETVHTHTRRTVREWRAYLKLTRNEMAEKLDIHPSTYSRMENHPGTIRMDDAAALAEAFGCNVKDIIFFEEKPNLKLDYVREA